MDYKLNQRGKMGYRIFFRILGGNKTCKAQSPGPIDGDDIFEAALIASNKVFEVDGQSLIPLQGAWGQCPKYELLSSDKVRSFL